VCLGRGSTEAHEADNFSRALRNEYVGATEVLQRSGTNKVSEGRGREDVFHAACPARANVSRIAGQSSSDQF